MTEQYMQSLFPEYFAEFSEDTIRKKSHERWIQQKSRRIGSFTSPNAIKSGKYGITKIKKYTGELPSKFITLQEINEMGGSNVGVLGFSYDLQLEKLETDYKKYLRILRKYRCVAEPDYSMRIGDALGSIVSTSFKSHNIAFFYQEHGCTIIPTMKWADEMSYDVCFDGYERGGAVLVSTMGVIRDERSQMYFKSGFKEMLKRVSPDSVVLYGEMKEWMTDLFPSQLDLRHIENEHISKLRKYGRKRCI